MGAQQKSEPLLAPKTILFTHFGNDWIRGSERCLLDLLANLDKTKFVGVVWCNSTIFEREVKALGFPVYRSRFTLLFGWETPRFDLKNYLKLMKFGHQLLVKHKVDLIHANSAAPNQWLVPVSQKANIPIVTHLHARYVFRDRLSLRMHQSDAIIGVSKPVVDQLVFDGVSDRLLNVVANGIDVQRLENIPLNNVRSKFGINKEDFVLATVGSLIERKGIDLILEAIPLIQSKTQQRLHLLVIGDGPEKENLIKITADLALNDIVHFLGERADAFGIIKASANLFVSGAREEVFGLVLAEANLAGLPVVAPAVGGIPSVIQEGTNGLLAIPDSSKSIALKVFELLENNDLYEELRKQSKNQVLDYFTIQKNTANIQAIYARTLKEYTPVKFPMLNRFLITSKTAFEYIVKRTKNGFFPLKKGQNDVS